MQPPPERVKKPTVLLYHTATAIHFVKKQYTNIIREKLKY